MYYVHCTKSISELEYPDELSAEIKCKLIIVLAHLKAIHLATSLLDIFVEAGIYISLFISSTIHRWKWFCIDFSNRMQPFNS